MTFTPDYLRSLGIDPTGMVFHGDTVPYDPALRSFSRDLRNYGTKGEAYMWKVLKNKQTGYRFNRQKPILHYVADFYCHELSLVVEIDGDSHNGRESQEHDSRRDREMKAIGLRVVRLSDEDVKRNPLGSAQQIFSQAGVPMPVSLQRLFTGQERLWPQGYMGRF